MANSYFNFKRFTINQDRCAMKVGTDGVLLGAWAMVGNEECSILDIGTGSGVVALIVAQRNENAIIDAIDIDAEAVEQAADNFELSPWGNRLSAQCSPLQEYNPSKKYKYIISNPPYFINSLKADGGRAVARHTDTLSYDDLIEGVLRLLDENGVFTAIFPYVESNIFVALAASKGLFCNKRLEVKGAANKSVKRVLLCLSRNRIEDLPIDTLIIENGERHIYTPKYIELTKDFYL